MEVTELHSFQSTIGEIAWDADASGLSIAMAGREHRLAYDSALGAGVVRVPMGEDVGAPFASHLLVAPGEEASYLLRIPLPAGDAEAEALVALLRANLDERWYDDLTAENYREKLVPGTLSAMPAWALPAAILAFVGLSALLLSACVIFSFASSGGWQIVGWQSVAGFVLWLVIVGLALYAYRKLWVKA